MNIFKKILFCTSLLAAPICANAQTDEVLVNPAAVYGQERKVEIGGITVEGVPNFDENVLIGLSGLTVGDQISYPGDEITEAIRQYWQHGFFSSARIEADSIVGNKIYLKITLESRPRVSKVNIWGVKKGEQKDLEEKIGIVRGNQLSPNMIDRADHVIKTYYEAKGYRNAEVQIQQHDDPNRKDELIVDINIDKHEKVKVRKIYITGNENIKTKKFHGGFFSGGLLKKTNEKGLKSLFKAKKFIAERYTEDKDRIIEKYNELGYRDAVLVKDSVVDNGDGTVDVHIGIDEGDKYYLRNVTWMGNTIYPTENLNRELRMKKGDVYNTKMLNERLNTDDNAIGNYYYNEGYLFSRVEYVEKGEENDSIDIEIRITEGRPAVLNKIQIFGNTRVYEEVVRRELKMKPGDLFSMDAYKQTAQEISQMGHFDPEALNPNEWLKPDQMNSTVDLQIGLTPKASDQVEFSLGWGQTGVIGKIGLKFNNFSMRNLFGRGGIRRGILPQGDAQSFEISGSTNGRYYQSYSISFMDGWFGRKRPNMLSVSAFFSRQTDISSNYYNSAYYNNYYTMMSGYGNYNSSYYNNYSSYYDPDKYIMLFGVSVGWGKRLTWPDNNFQVQATLGYTRYMLKDWEYFLITNGNCNNINLSLSLSRNTVFNPIFPRSGSQISLTVTATPPYSLWDGVDYANLATTRADANYMADMQRKYKWIEYHKWAFKSRFYTPLSSAKKCFVLMTRFDFGFLGHYNKHKRSPFETYYMGGDGMSGYSTSYYSETIGLRGYDNGCLTPYGSEGYAYSRMTLELRYPLMLNGSTNIYALGFLEGGNAWTSVRKFNPFDLKRSAGFGVRIFLPMVGLMGIDWAYGFDKVFGTKQYGGSQFHFILGQEF